jgi:PAS domain S-box-containing protein
MLIGISISFFPSFIDAQTQKIRFEHLSIENGLSQNSVLCIAQDRKGFMWFGTYEGLNRYDGYEFKVYKFEIGNPYSLSNNTVQSIYEDRSGVLWIGTEGGLDKYDPERDGFIHFKNNINDSNSVSSDRIQWISEDTSGILWIGTFGGGLNQFDKERKRFIRYQNNPEDPLSIGSNNVLCVYIDRLGNPCVATDRGVNRFDRSRNQFVRYQYDSKNPHSLSRNNAYRVFEDKTGDLWIGLWGGGLDRFDRKKDQFIHYGNNSNDHHSLSNDVVRSIYEDQTGCLWIGTWGGGLDQFDRENNRFIHNQTNQNDPSSLSNNSVLSIFEDRLGILWIGSDFGGVNKFDRMKIKLVHYQKEPQNINSLNNNTICSIAETIDGGKKIIWIGTQGGGLTKFDKEKSQFKHYQSDPHNPLTLNDNFIRTIIKDRTGTLWIGTTTGGLNQFDREKGTFTHYMYNPTNPNSLSNDDIFSLYEDRLGYIWVGTYGGGLNKFDPRTKKFTRYISDPRNPNSLSDNLVWSIFEDRTAVLWIGTEYGGLNQFDRVKNQFIHYKADPENPTGLSSNKILCIYEDRSGMLWLGTTNGLNKFDRVNKRISHYLEADGLPSKAIQSILEDEHGYLWFGTQKGLSKFDPHTSRFKNFKVSEGLQSNEFIVNACLRSQNGEMYFGGINGFNAFFPDSIKENLYIPSIVIVDFKIFNKSELVGKNNYGRVILEKSILETKEINLSYKENVFSFEFASLHLTSPENNKYAYMMVGFDTTWSYTDASRRLASYTNMSGGDYVFRVKGSNSDGIWNEEGASIRVIITPPFWQTLWFRMILLIVIAGFAFWIYKWREIIAQQRELEKITKSELKYRNLFENSLAGMMRLSTNTMDVLDANQALRRMFGVQEPIEIQQILQTIPPADLTRMQSIITQNGAIEDFETTVRRRDQTELFILFSGKYFVQEGWIEGVLIDVTERKRLEAKQLRTQRTESIGVLASGIAHDLKNLLVPVKMAVELLKRKHDDQQSQSLLTSIGRSAEHSIDLVRQVLAFVRGAEGSYVPVESSALLRGVVYTIQETLPPNIQVECTIPNTPAMVLGDATQLRQVLVNLLANAKDAMPHGGNLTISLNEVQIDKYEVSRIPNSAEGSFVVWSITDTGIGIPAEQVEKIFEPFYTTKEISKGTGLGLSIVAGIIKGHKGFITVESIVGKGTTFHVYLPEIRGNQPLSRT